jgi:hypothetical protein
MTSSRKALERPSVKFGPDLSPWTNAYSYWVPTRLVLSAWLQHGPFAAWIVSVLRPKVIAELGTHNGYSFFTFCEVARRLRLSTNCYAVDTWQGDDQAGFYDDSIFDDVNDVRTRLYPDMAVLLRGYFSDYVGSFPDGSIDLLHIDGRHGYEDVVEDFESWLPKLSQSGVVMFHDIAERQEGFGVWKLWEDVSKRYPSFAFEHGHGLGVIAVGSTVPAGLKPLFTASSIETEQIRDFYRERGEFIETMYQAKAGFADTSARLELTERQLSLVVVSYSWLFTRPLRAMVGLVPKRARASVRGAARRIRGAIRG